MTADHSIQMMKRFCKVVHHYERNVIAKYDRTEKEITLPMRIVEVRMRVYLRSLVCTNYNWCHQRIQYGTFDRCDMRTQCIQIGIENIAR